MSYTRRDFLKTAGMAVCSLYIPNAYANKLENIISDASYDTSAVGSIIDDPYMEEYRLRITKAKRTLGGPLVFDVAHSILSTNLFYKGMDKEEKIETIQDYIRKNPRDMKLYLLQLGLMSGGQRFLSIVKQGNFGEGKKSDVYVHKSAFQDFPCVVNGSKRILPPGEYRTRTLLAYAASQALDNANGIETDRDKLSYMDHVMVNPQTFNFMLKSRSSLSQLEHAKNSGELMQNYFTRSLAYHYLSAKYDIDTQLDRRLLIWLVTETNRRAPEAKEYPAVKHALNRVLMLALKNSKNYDSKDQV